MEWRIRRLHLAFSGVFRVSWATKYTERLVKIPGALDSGNKTFARRPIRDVEGVFEACESLRAQ